jgi:hypothetical protein
MPQSTFSLVIVCLTPPSGKALLGDNAAPVLVALHDPSHVGDSGQARGLGMGGAITS